MKNALALLVVVIVVVAGVVAAAQTAPASSRLIGVWKPDTSKGSIKMAALDFRVTVKQNGNEIVFEEGLQRDGARPKVTRYGIGVESENIYAGRREKATATWEDGRLTIKGQREMGKLATPVPFTLVVSVSPDGNELQMDERVDNGNTVFKSLRVFTREPHF